ncbi:MAG: hypothetical protein U1E10_13385 [Bdellovibrionales bacterium]|nr:hypothetical protein [Bdellovibrionales bacterium]
MNWHSDPETEKQPPAKHLKAAALKRQANRCLIPVIIFVFSIFAAPTFALAKSSAVATCGEYFHVLKRKLRYDYNPLLKLRHAFLRTGVADNVAEGPALPGKFGGTRRVFNKKDPNQPWEKYFNTPGFNDVLVNPDSLIHILGSENAKKLGFELTPTSAIVPDVAEFRASIIAFNRQFPEGDPRRLAANFYETGNKPLTGEQYRDGFLRQSELPMAKSGRLHFHDFTAHAGAAFMPKEIIDETKLRVRLFSEFDKYLQKIDPGLRRLVSDLYQKRIDNIIDVHSNRGQNNLVERAGGERGLNLQMHHLSNTYSTRASDDVREALLEILHYVKLRPEKAAALHRYVQNYMKEQIALNPGISELPFGLKAENLGTSEWDQVQERSAELMSERLNQLRTSFRDWNP